MTVRLFAGNRYYPRGGYEDFVGTFDDLTAAQAGFIAWYAEDSRNTETPPDYSCVWAHLVEDDRITYELRYIYPEPYTVPVWDPVTEEEQ